MLNGSHMPPAFADWEQNLYGDLFAKVGTDGSGRVGGLQAVEIFSRSGQDRQVLKDIWNLSDHSQQGSLDMNGFGIALRLLAHTQHGRNLSPDLIHQEPPGPPRLEGIPAPPTTTFRKNDGNSSRARSPAPGEDRRVPTPRDLRKYGRLFCRICDRMQPHGMISADEAREVFVASGLDNEQLKLIWDFSDGDHDGCLNWQEFVVAMHLIRRARAGQPLQQPAPELITMLPSLNAAQSYAAQPSRSPRSLSPMTTSVFESNQNALQTPEPSFSSGALSNMPGTGFEVSTSSKFPDWSQPQKGLSGPLSSGPGASFDAGANSDFPSWNNEGSEQTFPDSTKEKRHRRKKDERSKNISSTSDASQFEQDTSASVALHPESPPHKSRMTIPDQQAHGRDLDHFRRKPRLPVFGDPPPESVGAGRSVQPVEHLEALIEAEKYLVKQLRYDTEELNQELLRLEDACRREEQESSYEQKESKRMDVERRQLQQQLDDSQRQLAELKKEYDDLRRESVFLRQDHSHYSKEAEFLQRLSKEYARESQVLQQSIDFLEQSNRNLEAHAQSLEQARKDMVEQAQAEQPKLDKEKHETHVVMQALEALRNGGGSLDSASKAANLEGLGNKFAGLASSNELQNSVIGSPNVFENRVSGQQSLPKGEPLQHWSSGVSLLDAEIGQRSTARSRAPGRGFAFGRHREGV